MKKRNACVIVAMLAVSASLANDAGVFPSVGLSPTGEVWTARRFQRTFCGEDVWEPFNRTMFGVFDGLMGYVVDPFCYVYSSIVPKPLIKGIDNFSENLEYPVRLVSNLLMGEWRQSWCATERFVVNSTLGIGGLFDLADSWFGIPDSGASLSDTFASWGVPSGPPLALPFMPRASLRGHVGYTLDYAFDAKTWFDFLVPSGILLGYSWSLTPNKAPVWRGTWDNVFYHAEDSYSVYMPVAAAITDFNLKQNALRYCGGQYDRATMRRRAKGLAEGSVERRVLEADADRCVHDVRPAVHNSAARPTGLKGVWRDIPGYAPRAPALDSLRALCFSPLADNDFWWERRSIFNRDFVRQIDERCIDLGEGASEATYSFVSATESPDGVTSSERLAIVLPGIGAGRTAVESVAMAELLHANGYAVIIGDSIFHWEHMRSVNRGLLPGNLPEDVARYGDYLGRILEDLKKTRLVNEPEVSILGWSMGGLTTLLMADRAHRGELTFQVARFVAINPPVSLAHAAAAFNSTLDRSRMWTNEKAFNFFADGAASLYAWADLRHPRYDPACPPKDRSGDPWDYAPNLTEEQANFLVGQTIRVVFPALVTERHRTAPFPWIKSDLTWFHRNAFYDEIDGLTPEEYLRRYLPYCYPGLTPEELLARADLHRLEAVLSRDAKIAVLHTWNDPLVTDADRAYLDSTLGNRVTWFADGAHCGYFYTTVFKNELLRRLSGEGENDTMEGCADE